MSEFIDKIEDLLPRPAPGAPQETPVEDPGPPAAPSAPDPLAYLRDVFRRISAHPIKQLADLLPDKCLADRLAAAS